MDTLPKDHAVEISAGERFAFGDNWRRFLSVLNDARIAQAERDLKEMLGLDDLQGKSFLDIGSGSGLSSLAARRLGAKVVSLDYDPQSVACTQELRRRYFEGDTEWQVLEGSVLDREFIASLGTFDIVYSWGVLHHTGHMWEALENAGLPASVGGHLFVAIYNDQGRMSRWWTALKRGYNKMPGPLKLPYAVAVMGPRELKSFLYALARLQPMRYVRSWTEYSKARGMSRWHDIIDWIGGYPFEVAKPEEIFDFYKARGFQLSRMKTCAGGLGCNQFVFTRTT
ncbi:MAG TPA: class I SAM-dependent methyltransferase [Oscillatoriaceae cyanobacterium]